MKDPLGETHNLSVLGMFHMIVGLSVVWGGIMYIFVRGVMSFFV